MMVVIRLRAAKRRQRHYIFRLFIAVVVGGISMYAVHFLMLTASFNFGLFPTPMRKTPAFIITISNHDDRVPAVIALFRKYAHLDLHPHYGIHGNRIYTTTNKTKLTPGERGLRQTMKGFFKMARHRNYNEVFLFEDDAIPHVKFAELFDQLSDRCLEADVLLLGATIWHPTRTAWPSGVCFDADNRTYGAFALLIKQSAFLPILTWLYQGPRAPFDHMYRYLQIEGLTVRVAHPPFLVIPDISHSSLINNNRSVIQFDMPRRAERHDWHLEDYPVSQIKIDVDKNQAVTVPVWFFFSLFCFYLCQCNNWSFWSTSNLFL